MVLLSAVLSALAGVARYVHGLGYAVAFVLAALALAGQASLVSLATEHLGERLGTAATGVLQSTVGNLPEFFVVLFALQAHQRVVAQTAILGSILVNALLVLGLVMIAGSLRSPGGIMRFNPRLPNDTATLLLVASFIIILVGLADSSHDPASHHTRTISIVGAVAILLVYGTWMNQYLRGPVGRGAQTAERAGVPSGVASGASAGVASGAAAPSSSPAAAVPSAPRVSAGLSLTLLAGAGVASAFDSDWFVHALTPTIQQAHISRSFAGLVIVAIAGNAVENVAGIVLAWRRRMDLAIAIVKNSVAQIAAFLYPLLVLVSLATATSLTFALAPVYIGALLGTAVIIWQITGDGEGTAFEGAALVAAFVILATVAAFER
jgi:Ca2+:H+ antiporter